MLYATVCHGAEYIKRFSKAINKVGRIDTVHVLTDHPQYFDNCITHQYEEIMGVSQFSYYSKITFLFKLLLQLKQRVNYVDADFLRVSFNKSIIVDNTTVYTSIIIQKDKTKLNLLNRRKDIYKAYFDFLSKYELGNSFDYITEAFLSFPYLSNIDEIASRSKELQAEIESIFNTKAANWKKTELNRYAKNGIGFGEGNAVTVLAKEFNLNVIGVETNHDLLINTSLL